MGKDFWDERRVGILRRMWEIDGASGREIAEKIGDGISRNAVIGKAHRLGLSIRQSPIRNADGSSRAARKRWRPTSETAAYKERQRILGNLKCQPTLPADGGSPFKTCQFLDGEPRSRRFCGEPTFNFSSYCEEHFAVCYRPEPRK